MSETTEVNPATSPVNFVQITLVPRSKGKKDPLPGRVEGSNPYLIDPAEYYRRFPKKTVKEFEKGVEADRQRKTDDAIRLETHQTWPLADREGLEAMVRQAIARGQLRICQHRVALAFVHRAERHGVRCGGVRQHLECPIRAPIVDEHELVRAAGNVVQRST